MTIPLAIQLYSVRNELERDFEGTVRRIAQMGYGGVETAGFPGTTPAEAGRLFRSLGLSVPAAHLPLPLDNQQNQVLESAEGVGSERIIATLRPEAFESRDQILRTCERFNRAHQICASRGFKFGIHNHWWEFEMVDGVYPYRVMMEQLDPEIFFEIDVYWVRVAGHDVTEVLRELDGRAPLLHIKDGPATKEAPMVAVGEGVMDTSRIVQSAGANVAWLIVELDHCATDMMTAVEHSYSYLITRGLASGTTS